MPKEDFNIDDFKKSWQEQVPEVYQSSEIEAMLNKKSRNYVKYILWISIAEFLFFAAINIYTVFGTQNDSSFMDLLQKLGVNVTNSIEEDFQHLYLLLKIFSLAITAFFVIMFYNNYKRIDVENNLKKFILQIIKFKKTVNLFILTNIIVLVVFTAVLTGFTMNVLKFQSISLNNSAVVGFTIGILVSLSIGILLILLYYRIVYGIIMRRLDKKLKQLQQIEQEQDE